MNILRNAGTHKILALTERPLELIELCGRTAYQSRDKITPDSARKFVKMLIDRGHESVLEHATLSVQFDNCSIGLTRELNRHRLISVTEKSTRYVNEEDFNVVLPPQYPKEFVSNAEGTVLLKDHIKDCEAVYRTLRKIGWAAQDARQMLPIAIASQIVCTSNFREWRHIFKTRTTKAAHWEIRRVLTGLLWDLQDRIPVVFDDIHSEFTEQEAKDWGWICECCQKTPNHRPLYPNGQNKWVCPDCFEKSESRPFSAHC